VADLVRQQVRHAILSIVPKLGGHLLTRPWFRDRPDRGMTVSDAEPMAALQACAAIGQALRPITHEYVRRAREYGHSWPDIGIALGLQQTGGNGVSAAEAAYDRVAGEPGFGVRAFAWACPVCRGMVIDRGPEAGHPHDREEGHATGCPRLAADVAAWNAGEDADGIP
jgi:hypothetical protein